MASRLVLVALTAIRIITELLRLIFVTIDGFVMGLGEASEKGLRGVESARAWVRFPGAVLLGLAFVLLQLLAIFTVFLRQTATKLNDLIVIVGLAEGEERITETPSTPPTG